jgi:proteasome lid subunit RPN8/RPN11
MTVSLTQDLLSAIHHHLVQTYPNEGGGFLVGKVADGRRIVTEVHHVDNTFEAEEQFHRYLAESGAYERIEDEADARGLALLGYYHSHPDAPAVPSEYDRVHAWPFFVYLIVSIRDKQPESSRVWQLREDRSVFDETTLRVS